MRNLELSAFEAAVLEWIAARSSDVALQRQLLGASVSEREHTGVGCYSKLVVDSEAPVSTAPYANHGPLDGPHFESTVVDNGGGTLLWFEAGRVDLLEIYAHGDYFPADHAELLGFTLAS